MQQQTPIFDGVVAEQQWSPEALRPKFDIDAVIAASYGIVGRQRHASRARKRKQRKAREQQQEQQTS